MEMGERGGAASRGELPQFRLAPLTDIIIKHIKNSSHAASDTMVLFDVVRDDPSTYAMQRQLGPRGFVRAFANAYKRTDIRHKRLSDKEEMSIRTATSLLAQNRALALHVSSAPTLDVAFLLDLTKGRGCKARSLGRGLLSVIYIVLKEFYPLRLRFSLVGYRDYNHENPSERLLVHPFSPDVWRLRQTLLETDISCGGDEADDVLGGMQAVCGLDWQAATRVVVHIGSSPGHGRALHNDECTDDYPDGDPSGVDPSSVVQKMLALRISYSFVRICWRTDQMVKLFNAIAGEPFIDTLPFKAASFESTIANCVIGPLEEHRLRRRCEGDNTARLDDLTLDALCVGP